MYKKLINEAGPNNYHDIRVQEEPKDNTIPLDLMLIEYEASMGKEKLLKHITQLFGGEHNE